MGAGKAIGTAIGARIGRVIGDVGAGIAGNFERPDGAENLGRLPGYDRPAVNLVERVHAHRVGRGD